MSETSRQAVVRAFNEWTPSPEERERCRKMMAEILREQAKRAGTWLAPPRTPQE